MEVASGETETPASVGALAGPGQMLGFSLFDRFSDGWIPFVRPIRAVHCGSRGYGAENRGYPMHVFPEAHVEIPLVEHSERNDSARDRVIGQWPDIGSPRRVHGPVQFEATPNPIQELLLTFLFGGLDCVMERDEADSFLHETADGLEAVADQKGIS